MAETDDRHTLAYEWTQVCEENNILVTFKGDFNQDLVNAILLITEQESGAAESSTVARTRVFSIMVECMQNIRKYSAGNAGSDDLTPGIILVSMKDGVYRVLTGNPVANANVPSLKEKLEQVRSLNKDELKQLHKSVLSTTSLSEKSGAGLGLISIARKADRLDYNFRKLDENISFYSLEISLSNSSN
ncbi:MAG: SiaB family protein kinase [Bacteroidia bacterium]